MVVNKAMRFGCIGANELQPTNQFSCPLCRDRLEQLERQRERERKLRDQQQKEQRDHRDQKERERRAEERRKEREARREGSSVLCLLVITTARDGTIFKMYF